MKLTFEMTRTSATLVYDTDPYDDEDENISHFLGTALTTAIKAIQQLEHEGEVRVKTPYDPTDPESINAFPDDTEADR